MATEPSNPFPLVGYHGPAYFCDREEETAIIEQSIRSGVNVTLVSLRRMGKTSLMTHVQARRAAKKLPTIVVDLQATTSIRGLTEALATAAARSLLGPGRKIMEGLRDIASRVGASIAINAQGEPSLAFSMQDRRVDGAEDLRRLLMMIEESKQPVLVVMDEFQEIATYADEQAEGLLRAYIQPLTKTRFIFSGSRKAMIENMFADHRRPFYASTRHMELGALPEESYRDFVRAWFKTNRRVITDEAFERIREVSEGRTFHMQLIANRLWEDQSKTIDLHHVQYTVSAIVAEQSHLFIGFRALLTPTQWAVLLAIAHEKRALAPLSEQFRRRYLLPPASSVKRALQALIERELVYVHADGHGVEDPFFAEWLRTTFERP